MDKVAKLTLDQRRELFAAAGARRRISPAIIEKDFWVCWVLKKLFTDPKLKEQMVFKGGTPYFQSSLATQSAKRPFGGLRKVTRCHFCPPRQQPPIPPVASQQYSPRRDRF